MKVRRSRLTEDYVQVPNRSVRDARLSYMARGILVELLSRPDGWEVTADELWRLATQARGEKGEGRRSFRAAFAELKEYGYISSQREQLPGGRHGTVLTVYDIPGHADVPAGGTSGDSAQGESAGRSDVPSGGTPDGSDVPHGGTPARPAQKDVSAGRSDVPLSDVPHGGTSNRKRSTKTGEKTGGDGRRPTTGSTGRAASGSAALQDEPDAETAETTAAAIGCVIGLLPRPLRDQLPSPVPRTVVDTITTELRAGIAAEALIARAERRWLAHGYDLDNDTTGGGPGLLRPVGVAVALLRRGKCTHPRCDDGVDIDTREPCRTCEREAEDRRAAQTAPVQGTFLAAVPDLNPAPAPEPRPGPMRDCHGCQRPSRTLPADGWCRDCRPDNTERTGTE
ncbi:hypothetical protein ACWDA7_38890 [Streptomyces sp. NPDC001156]